MSGTSIARICSSLCLAAALAGCSTELPFIGPHSHGSGDDGSTRRVIVFVWDGLRGDAPNTGDTPNLLALESQGVTFTNHHSTYPTFTMLNASAFATGAYPQKVGFFGNTLWAPGATGHDASAHPVDFQQPQFTEDWSILASLDSFYQHNLLMVGSLFQAAQAAGLKTAAVGKSGPAFLQDREEGGVVLDEKMAYPLPFAQGIQAAGFPLPKAIVNAYPAGSINLAPANGDPTAQAPKVTLADGKTPDPTSTAGAAAEAANQYLMSVYLGYVLPVEKPDLSVIWFRDPDTTEHNYGPGTPNFHQALKNQDQALGILTAGLAELGLDTSTDLIVVSDHGHSNVSGRADLFPLRAVSGGAMGAPDPAGFSASGDVRLADLLTRAGFTAYDGSGCNLDPVLSGIKADGSSVYPLLVDTAGTVCGVAGTKYTTASFKVPPTLPPRAIVVAANGGSDYLYVPDGDVGTVAAAVRFLQGREETGPIFAASRYGLDGTLPLSLVNLENAARAPDVIVSYDYDETLVIAGMPGVEYNTALFGQRGMHGSFSPIDVHNFLTASGPHFAAGVQDDLPTANVDLAPTIARILGLSLPDADGRPLVEALSDFQGDTFAVSPGNVSSTVAGGLTMQLPTDPNGQDVDPTAGNYQVVLRTQVLDWQGVTYPYFDAAKAYRW